MWTGVYANNIVELNADLVNPCTADVMRARESALFPNKHDRSSYLVCLNVDQYLIESCPEGMYFAASIGFCLPLNQTESKCPLGACKNEADCLTNPDNTFKCHCRVGFTGQTCEINIDECALEGIKFCSTQGLFIKKINFNLFKLIVFVRWQMYWSNKRILLLVGKWDWAQLWEQNRQPMYVTKSSRRWAILWGDQSIWKHFPRMHWLWDICIEKMCRHALLASSRKNMFNWSACSQDWRLQFISMPK